MKRQESGAPDIAPVRVDLGTRLRRRLRILRVELMARIGRRRGTSRREREPGLVVSLTSWEPRLPGLHLCTESLLRQTVRPDRLILWLADGVEPPPLVASQRGRGLEVRHCSDIRSYKKIVPTLSEVPGATVVTADDDIVYHGTWLEELLERHRGLPEAVICHIGHGMLLDGEGELLPYSDWDRFAVGFAGPSPLLFPTGVGGVLYPPGAFHDDVDREDIFMELAPDADDVWLKAMTLLRGLPAAKVAPGFSRPLKVPGSQVVRLWVDNVKGNGNDERIRAVFDRYGLYDRLRSAPD